MTAASSSSVCVACAKPLVLQLEDDEEDLPNIEHEEVDDDLQVQCGCHFHWQCLLDSYELTACPNCQKDLTSTSRTGEQQVLCNLKNEGGLQEGLDILPILTEETYLKTFPEERRCQAFLEFCGSGDMEAIVDLLKDDDNEEHQDIDVLRYQDQIRTMNSGLHVAIQNDQVEVVWLLLLLASTLDVPAFPPEVISAAEQMGLQRRAKANAVDIRVLQDSEGKTAEERAAEKGIAWREWIHSGRLKPPA